MSLFTFFRQALEAVQLAVSRLVSVPQAVLYARAYVYPPMGLLYLARRPSLWPAIFRRILPRLTLSVVVILYMFFFAYIPQATVLTFTKGALGPISAVALVLSESSVMINILAKALLLEQSLYDMFDEILVGEGQEALSLKRREVVPEVVKPKQEKVMNQSEKSPRDTRQQGSILIRVFQTYAPSGVLQYFGSLPSNMVPVMGSAFSILQQSGQGGQGVKTEPIFHNPHIQLNSLNNLATKSLSSENTCDSMVLGAIVMLINMIPLVSSLYMLSSTAGNSLWSSEVEQKAV